MSSYYKRVARLENYKRLGWVAFTAATVCGLLAIWLQDARLAGTAGVLLFAAMVSALAGADL